MTEQRSTEFKVVEIRYGAQSAFTVNSLVQIKNLCIIVLPAFYCFDPLAFCALIFFLVSLLFLKYTYLAGSLLYSKVLLYKE